jgi:uncharacterized membrane protein YhaH (DUF805 family)
MEPFLHALFAAFFTGIKKYADFTGRARRREFWMFALANCIVGLVFGILTRIPILGVLFTIISGFYSLLILIPGIAVSVRRLHDTNKSGWLLFLCFIPVVGVIVLFLFCAQEGYPGDNQYGPDPRDTE